MVSCMHGVGVSEESRYDEKERTKQQNHYHVYNHPKTFLSLSLSANLLPLTHPLAID